MISVNIINRKYLGKDEPSKILEFFLIIFVNK